MQDRDRKRPGAIGVVPRTVLRLAYAGVVPACAAAACADTSNSVPLAIAGFSGGGHGGNEYIVLAVWGFGAYGGNDYIVLAGAGFGAYGGTAGDDGVIVLAVAGFDGGGNGGFPPDAGCVGDDGGRDSSCDFDADGVADPGDADSDVADAAGDAMDGSSDGN